jgi:hypothetical protein
MFGFLRWFSSTVVGWLPLFGNGFRMRKAAGLCLAWLTLAGASSALHGEERLLLAADNQVLEIDRSGRVTDSLARLGHGGIYDAWRLPDGGVAYVHSRGLAVFDAQKKLVLSHPARAGSKGTEANGCDVLEGGERFALLDAGVNQVRVVDRAGKIWSETPLPSLDDLPTHSRYRTVRAVPGEKAFWVGQYSQKALLKVEEGTGTVLATRDLEALLKPKHSGPAFSALLLPGGRIWAATSTGRQLLKLGTRGELEQVLSAGDLGLNCRYLLGTQQLENGSLMVSCGDYHLKGAEEGRDLLAEIDQNGKVLWRLTRAQLVDQIEGYVDPRTGLEEMRITHVHVYDSERPSAVLKVVR